MTAFLIASTSGFFLAVFSALLLAEDARGRRILFPRFREMLDRGTLRIYHALLKFRTYIGAHATRRLFHAATHWFVRILMAITARLYARLEYIREKNKRRIHALRHSEEPSHLNLIADHKAANGLNDEARLKLKKRSIEGS